jgi:hypothetical protein
MELLTKNRKYRKIRITAIPYRICNYIRYKEIPNRLKGDCKSAGYAFVGSNPSLPNYSVAQATLFLLMREGFDHFLPPTKGRKSAQGRARKAKRAA